MKRVAGGEILGITHASTHAQVSQLVRKGYLKREPRKARGLAVVREPPACRAAVLRGAGREDEIADLVPVPYRNRRRKMWEALLKERMPGR